MVFSSLLFLFRFLPAILLCYYIAPKPFRNLALFLFSLVFYAWGEPVYIVLMLFSTVVDYTVGRMIHYFKGKNSPRAARVCLITSLVVNLSLLGVFKYADLLIGTANSLFGMERPLLELALPIGISFYTFQTMSYSIDVYRGEAAVQTDIVAFGAYVAMFPQLIAGPIVRYQTVADEMTGRRESLDDLTEGILRFVSGLGKKVLLANTIGELFRYTASLPRGELSTATAWIGTAAFTLQIYFDFSGYSDMAIGLGRMFGFHFLENFDHPYESKSITEFWRRWHISLGTWFREYVYIPLGGNRKGLPRQLANIILVWFLTGLWHGASWNFVLWGLYFGVLLMAEKLFLLRILNRLPAWAARIYTIFLVMAGWAVFSYCDMADGDGYLRAMAGAAGRGLLDRQAVYLLFGYGGLLLLGILGSTSLPKRWAGKFCVLLRQWEGAAECGFVLVVFLLSLAYLVSGSYNPFLYFRF